MPMPMLRGDNDDGHALVARGDHAGQKIRRTGTGISEHGGHLTGRLVQPFRHVDGGRLVTDGNESHVVLVQLGEQRIDLGTRESEDELDALGDQTSQQKFSTSDFAHMILRRGIGIDAFRRLLA